MINLWLEIFRCIHELRPACSRQRTFLWMVVAIVSLAIRQDTVGVTSFIRGSFLRPACYDALLHLFHSDALDLSILLKLWVKLAMRLFCPVKTAGFIVFAADGLKIPKEGKKMPAVKCLHQESGNNTKPEFIMGHSFQAISMLVKSLTGQVFSVPLVSRITEGIIAKNSDKSLSLLDKLVIMFLEITQFANVKAILVADAYYASKTVIEPLVTAGHHLITRARNNSVAYELIATPTTKKRGRPKLYGEKVYLKNLFNSPADFIEADSPIYGDQSVVLQYRVVDLMWRSVGRVVRFVLVKHPVRGKAILLSTSLNFDPLTIIKIYGWRFKIEVSFKQAVHTVGTYAYHFWMKDMRPIKRGTGDQNIVSRQKTYKFLVQRKMNAYHRYVALGCITHGLLLHLAINFSRPVWKNFDSWLRTMNKNLVPSELVVSHALKSSFCEFLVDSSAQVPLKKFIKKKTNPDKFSGISMAG